MSAKMVIGLALTAKRLDLLSNILHDIHSLPDSPDVRTCKLLIEATGLNKKQFDRVLHTCYKTASDHEKIIISNVFRSQSAAYSLEGGYDNSDICRIVRLECDGVGDTSSCVGDLIKNFKNNTVKKKVRKCMENIYQFDYHINPVAVYP